MQTVNFIIAVVPQGKPDKGRRRRSSSSHCHPENLKVSHEALYISLQQYLSALSASQSFCILRGWRQRCNYYKFRPASCAVLFAIHLG